MVSPRWSPQPLPPSYPPPARRPARSNRGLYIFIGVTAVIAVVTVVAVVTTVVGRSKDTGMRVGDCVAVSAATSGELRATTTKCDTDLSYTIGAMANQTGDCVPDRYDQFRVPFADSQTSQLCLVPNLVVGHCYKFGIPMGRLDAVSCSGADKGMLRIAKKLDVDDTEGCADKTQFAMAYPSPARTFCAEMTP
jgi:hypothetical protein